MIRNCWIVLYDRDGTIVDLHPPAPHPFKSEEVIGQPATKVLRPIFRPSFQDAFSRVIAQQSAVVWDGQDMHDTTWRVWLFPMKRPPLVAAAAIARQWPGAVMRLTAIERRICAAVVTGKQIKELANELGIESRTVSTRKTHIAKKLGLHTHALASWCGLHEEWLS